MKNTKLLTLIVALLAVILCFASCGTSNDPTDSAAPSEAPSVSDTTAQDAKTVNITVIVKDKDGKSTELKVETEKANLADALVEKGLVSGDDSEYGLYVKTVNGTTLDYDKDGAYWAFYTNGEYAIKGVDSTDIVPGENYEFRAEKG